MSKKARIKFAFQITEGPNAGLACPGWRVWTHGTSTYLAQADSGDKWKLSLHGDAAWRFAQTAEDLRSPAPSLPAGHDRAPWKFTPPPFENGTRLAFVVAATRAAMLNQPPVRPGEIIVGVDDRWDQVTTVALHMTLPGIELQTSREIVANPLPLAEGRRLWLSASSEKSSESNEPETSIVGSMIQPMSPEVHGVLCPGLLVKGIRL